MFDALNVNMGNLSLFQFRGLPMITVLEITILEVWFDMLPDFREENGSGILMTRVEKYLWKRQFPETTQCPTVSSVSVFSP